MKQEDYNKATPIIKELEERKTNLSKIQRIPKLDQVTLDSNGLYLTLTSEVDEELKEHLYSEIIYHYEDKIKELEAELEAIGDEPYKPKDWKIPTKEDLASLLLDPGIGGEGIEFNMDLSLKSEMNERFNKAEAFFMGTDWRNQDWLQRYQELRAKHTEEEEKLFREWEANQDTVTNQNQAIHDIKTEKEVRNVISYCCPEMDDKAVEHMLCKYYGEKLAKDIENDTK